MADNRAVALRYLRGKGLTPAQAAGVVGSLMQESGLKTTAKNPTSGAYGIGQWLGGRKTNLLNSGKHGNLSGQLDFLWSELQGPERAALDRLRKAHTVADAAAAFTWGFERPGRAEANMPNRIRQGREALKLAGGSSGGGGGGTATTSTTKTTPGQTTQTQLTSGGDFTQPQLAQRQKPTVTGPQAPSYVTRPSVQFQMPDLAGRQASIRDAIARIGNVPQETTTETVTSPSQTTTTTSQTRASSGGSSGKAGSKVLELIFNDGGRGFGIKNGQQVAGSQVFSGVWGGHANHVHVAAGPKTTIALGKLAQKMGLHVGENPAFGGVDIGAHVPGSYHGKREAIDVSGDPKLMKQFAKRVVQYNKTRALPA